MTDNYTALLQLASALHKSRLWKTGSVEQALAVILMGRELGIGPTTALSNITIAMGKPTLGYSLVGALIQKSGRYGYTVTKLTDTEASIDFFERVGFSGGAAAVARPLGTSIFTLEDARRAGLLNARTGTWDKYQRNMLLARALTNGARWYCPEVFGGAVYDPSELDVAGELPPPVPDEPIVEAEYTPAPPPSSNANGVTIEGLLERYTAEQILGANGGNLPATDEELERVKQTLTLEIGGDQPPGV